MKINIYYKRTNKPWGGVNSFLNAFAFWATQLKVELKSKLNDDFEIVFFSGPYKDRTRMVNIKYLKCLKEFGTTHPFLRYFIKRAEKKVVYRCDGFRDEYAGLDEDPADRVQKECLKIADLVIFQNEFCLKSAQRPHIGFNGENYRIVHNGVNQEMFQFKSDFWDGKRTLKVFAANWSSNPKKGYATIAEFSTLPGVELTFCGQWPDSIDKKNVKALEAIPQSELAKEFCKHDVLLHPAEFDPSPNVCIEAISCGLPILYHSTSGIKEVAGDCGLEINEKNLNETLTEFKNNYNDLLDVVKKRYKYFSMERCAKEYFTAFEEILDEQQD